MGLTLAPTCTGAKNPSAEPAAGVNRSKLNKGFFHAALVKANEKINTAEPAVKKIFRSFWAFALRSARLTAPG